MAECDCGAWVSAAFARVLSDRDGEVRACLECSGRAEILAGAAAGREQRITGWGGVDVQ